MSLQDKLDAHKAQFQAKAPREVREIMHRATEDLRHSGILDGTLEAGDRIPDFAMPNAAGELISSRALLSRGPLVICFYRGKW